MTINGIYTLANDIVYDQLVALLNSIEVNAGRSIPICIIPYDQRLDKVKAEISQRPNVSLFTDSESLTYWDNFAAQVWKNYPRAQKTWRVWGFPELYRVPMHRKLCALDGQFDNFIYFDADTLLMGEVDYIFEKLNNYDWVTNDFQYKSDIKYIFDGKTELLKQTFPQQDIQSQLFCAGWFGTKKQVFSRDWLATILEKLNAGEADVMALGGPDQSLFNYLVLCSQIKYYNFAYEQPEATPGSHWSSNFEVIDQILYDQGRRLTYIHYMSVGAYAFTKLSAGEDVDIAYRDVFLHYRFLKSPELKPQTLTRPTVFDQWQESTHRFFRQKVGNLKLNYRNFKDRIAEKK
ncbi:Npun_R2821/Npun_R2822 family protein [Calothrix sp. 336/3]|uniref:Npun_R2821/Npun_R2822 family protein n=1 Tax=Calothrix sp. 336/3 TaxID=1337936 RepID=UPI0004E31878|nr:Npun_R2821/Npun_R2822 family protein [Calothrix sp. 336/3]AKG24494.1 sugar transferase [Calothrix sp. 336/3]